MELASELLAQGREYARQRQNEGRAYSGAGIALGVIASLGLRRNKLSRRRFLRNSMRAAVVVALAPGVGFSILSEVVVPSEIDAFDEAAAQLASLGERGEALLQASLTAPGERGSTHGTRL